MAVPSPPVPLFGGCTAIYQNALYAYQANAFQSLDLETRGVWTNLTMGESVDGGKCVLGTQEGQDVLYVVGGAATTSGYSGLQRYRFSDKTWQTITFENSSVVQNRMGHSATFLNDTQSILVYAGYQDDVEQATSETFTISTSSSPVTRSYISNDAPPGTTPILLPWDTSDAIMVGGSSSNQQVWFFNPNRGWFAMNQLLPPGMPDMNKAQGALIQSDNSSKVLELFDTTQSPNVIVNLMLTPADGQISELNTQTTRDLTTRDINLGDWPQYNSTLAPNTVRTGANIAQSPDGTVVISGGQAAGADSVAMFNQNDNAWVNTQALFDPSGSTPSPSSAAATPSGTTASTTSNAAAAATVASGDNGGGLDSTQRTILGAVLGGVFGLIALAVIVLIVLRSLRQRDQRKRQQERDVGREKSRPLVVEGGAAAYEEQAGFRPEPAPFQARRVEEDDFEPRPMQRNFTRWGTGLSDSSRDVVIPIERPSSRSPSPPPRRQGPRTTGWGEGLSQYFPQDQAPEPLLQSQERSAGFKDSLTVPMRDTTYSDYTASTNPHESAEVEPLTLHDGLTGRDSEDSERGGASVSAADPWDPTHSNRHSVNHQSISSMGESTTSTARPGERILISHFPGVPRSRGSSIVSPLVEEDRGMRTLASFNLGHDDQLPSYER